MFSDYKIPPRISSVLRVVLEKKEPLNLEKEIIAREAQISRLVQEQDSSRGDLTWRSFAEAGVRGQETKKKLKEFVDLAVRICANAGIEDPAEMLYEAMTSGIKGAKKEAEQFLGHQIPKEQWQRARSLALELKAQKNQGAGSSTLKDEGDLEVEFGIDLGFIDDFLPEEQELQPVQMDMDAKPSAPPGLVEEAQMPALQGTILDAVDAGWLVSKCQEHAEKNGSMIPALDLCRSILETLSGANDDAALQGGLFDLLGEGGFDLILELAQNKEALLRVNFDDCQAILEVLASEGPKEPEDFDPMLMEEVFNQERTEQRRGPLIQQQITIQTEEEKMLNKLRRKEQQKVARQAQAQGQKGGVQQPDWLAKLGFDQDYLATERSLGLQGGEAPKRSEEDIRGFLLPEGTREYHGHRSALPPGHTRTYESGYEEVRIPAPPRPAPADKDSLVPISSLEPWAQVAFKGCKRLNRMQSKVFETAYYTSENMLICAPTGAGKTNVAMLTLLQLVRNHLTGGGVMDRGKIKAIYIAPMKALAQEVVSKFSERLGPLGLIVREMTGDMQLTKAEVESANLIVTTPEKWDVVTRKGGDGSLITMVELVIIDEVHLLADERGGVIETIVARMQRYVESAQKLLRLVGLSATLPNYKDVATFLKVSPSKGLYHFGPEYRPVPLGQTFVGVTEKQRLNLLNRMHEICYKKALAAIRRGKQVMVFVHSRKDTGKTAEAIIDLASKHAESESFSCHTSECYSSYKAKVTKSPNKEVQDYFLHGFGIHHAGMLRKDRTLTEKMFEDGAIKVLVCTATLAWGVNLPAHTVIVKGTEIYNPEKGGMVDLSILDVLQIFGRAGRPQFDTEGDAVLITTHASLSRYLALLAHQAPIESSFIKNLPDHLNAEINNGTVTNMREAVAWLSYTYLYVRLLKNPMAYGTTWEQKEVDPMLEERRYQLIAEAAKVLDDYRMIRFDQASGNLAGTHMGRISSHYYIRAESIQKFNEGSKQFLGEGDAITLLCSAKEFSNIKMRPEEEEEIGKLSKRYCSYEIKGAVDDCARKTSILLQSYISQVRVSGFTIVSDTNYIAQNAARVARALFEICIRRNWCALAWTYLSLSKSIDKRVWWNQTPLRQFDELPYDVIKNLEKGRQFSIEEILDMDKSEVGSLAHHHRLGEKVQNLAKLLPHLDLEASIQPITRGILRVTLQIRANFKWQDKYHGTIEPWWIWMEDYNQETIYHHEYFLLSKKTRTEEHVIAFTIPIHEPLPPQYYIRAISDRWVGCEVCLPVSFKHLILPDRHPPHTPLLDLHPIPKEALNNPRYEALYRFDYFNPIQGQAFHVLYHTDKNVLVGAPTGSGKTIIGELAILRMLNKSGQGNAKAVYIAPLKALARERLKDWRDKLGKGLGLSVLEVSGDVTPDFNALKRADILVTTPEKWDGITRSWQRREYVKKVEVLIIDEIHLLGEDRGPVLEVIVSRMRYISEKTGHNCRVLGLSTALANPRDLADWLGIPANGVGLFNFHPSVRPIPMEVHIQGYPGKHYCPRMATMNKPTYAAIKQHSPTKPVLVFVASRRQTRLTALDLISFCAAEDQSSQWLHMPEDEASAIASTIKDTALQHTLVFGVGIHHAGLEEHDRTTVEELFVNGKIQILVCTSTLAWGVNFPAHLVVVKGTEFFDGKSGRYVDFPITDVLQMMGRAGRPQFDTTAVACVLVHEPKKIFYQKFLYSPFPVESSLREYLHNHISAEIASGSIKTKQDAVEYLMWTYFFRRLLMNPTYYHLADSSPKGVQDYLLTLIESVLTDLEASGTIEIEEDFYVRPTILGHIASYYYLDYHTVGATRDALLAVFSPDVAQLAKILSDAEEFSELPVRHNEEHLNADLAQQVPWETDPYTLDSPHTKTFLLLQAHFNQCDLPIADYINDTKSVLDQALRVINGLVDIAADEGLLEAALGIMKLSQMVVQGKMPDDNGREGSASSLTQLPFVDEDVVRSLNRIGDIKTLHDLVKAGPNRATSLLQGVLSNNQIRKVVQVVKNCPNIHASASCEDAEGMEEGRFIVAADGDYALTVDLCKFGGVSKVYAPRFHKPKSHGWWLVLGSADGELLALKRIATINGSQRTQLNFIAPEETGDCMLTLYLVPDSILGLDQQIPILLEIIENDEMENDSDEEAMAMDENGSIGSDDTY